MKTIIIIVVALLLVLSSCATSKQKTTMDALTTNLWAHGDYKESVMGVLDFSSDSIRFLSYKNREFCSRNLSAVYYLSDTPDEVFDDSKVGKVKNGRYIIRKNISPTPLGQKLDSNQILVSEILKQTDSTYTYRILYSPRTWVLNQRKDKSLRCHHLDSMPKTTMGILKLNIWQDENGWRFMDFGTDTLKFFKAGKKEEPRKHTLDALYYLSDTPDEVFDQSKVGNVGNGKYIISRNIYPSSSGRTGNLDYIYVTEIVKLFDYAIIEKSFSDPLKWVLFKKKDKFHECRLKQYGKPYK